MPQDSPPSDMAFLDLQFPEFMQPTMKDQHQIDFQHLPSTDANLKSCSNPNPVVTDDEGDCMKRAFTAIKHLHMPAESCLAAGISPGKIETFRTIDSTLMTNRAARETVLRILACPCAHGKALEGSYQFATGLSGESIGVYCGMEGNHPVNMRLRNSSSRPTLSREFAIMIC